jgi:ABC-type multidrug transport system fused ATPase/permease subunit
VKWISSFRHDRRIVVLTATLSKDIGFFNMRLTGVILPRLSEEVQKVCDAYTRHLIGFMHAIIQFFSDCVIYFSQSSKVRLLVCGALPFYALMNSLGQRFTDRLWSAFNNRRTDTYTQAEEILALLRMVWPMETELRE